MTTNLTYPIGTPGQPWGEPERAMWRAVTSTFNLTHFSNFKLTHLS
ncbi:hypothetical protein ACWGY7_21970 [Xanthomonas axonopodis pv. khayae]